MKKYTKVTDLLEKRLEDIVRKAPDLIEDGLSYVDHQRRTQRGPLDVLFVDSGKALIVAELKVTEDDGMLVQGIDYFDYVTSNIEGFARAYKDNEIDVTEKPRLFLIAPSFSIALLNRCKWIDMSISLFTFQCIAFEDEPRDIIPVFQEITIPSRPLVVVRPTIEGNLAYIKDDSVRNTVKKLLAKIAAWNKDDILIEPIKYDISMKVSGRVFSYLGPRRKHFIIYTYDDEGKWTGVPVHQEEDIRAVTVLLKSNYEKYRPTSSLPRP